MGLARLQSYDFVKRVIDVLASGFGLLVLLPLLLGTAFAVMVYLGHPVIFSQPRPGLGGRVFTLYKFRTMRIPDPANGSVTDEQRLTRFGLWLRSTSLDEMPTLWNVLKGDMSLVGPRPLLVEYLDRYSPEQARRHEARPGVTGLAQVSGRNALTWQEKFRLDVEYVDSRSLTLDLSILARTAKSVLTRQGISADGHMTARKFGESDA